MSSLISNIPKIKEQYHINIDLLYDIGAIGMENADSLVSSLKAEGESNVK
jgi:hypothetical protein